MYQARNTPDIDELTSLLTLLQVDKDDALRAFLILPNVNAMDDFIMEELEQSLVGTWPDIKTALAAISELDEREEELFAYAKERRLYYHYLTPDYEALLADAEWAFDFVELEGRCHVFYK